MQKTNQQSEILLVGGNGKTGRHVAERLAERGIVYRHASRSTEIPFDWNAPETWAPALHGAAAAYVTYFPDISVPGAAAAIHAFATLAVSCGVRRLVLLSGRGEKGALAGEQAIRDSGADWTIVRSSFFFQNFTESLFLEPLLAGEVAFPADSVQEPFIDARDIADVVVAALTDDRHIGQLYEVTGPRLLTFREAVAEIAAVTQRSVVYIPVTLQDYHSGLLSAGVPADVAAFLAVLFGEVLDGRNAYLADGVLRACGKQPRDFTTYVVEQAKNGAWNGHAALQPK